MNDYILMIAGSDIDTFYDVEAFPGAGDVGMAVPRGQKVGGCVLNAAVVARSYGSKVKVLDYLKSDDPSTELFISTLNGYGVDTSEIRYGKDVVNGSCLILTNGDEKCIYVIEPVHPYYEVDEGLQKLLNEAGYIYTLMHTAKLSFADVECLREARRNGARIIFDGASQYNEQYEIDMILELASGVFMNRTCFERLESKSNVDVMATMFENGCQFICITDGSRGADLYVPGTHYHHDSYKVNVVDSTGAGDTFAGCFLAMLMKGYPYDKCLKMASAAGAYACLGEGGMSGAYNEEGLNEFIKKAESLQ